MPFAIGPQIKKIREAQGLSQKQLAEAIGISSSRMSNWELGINRPDADSLKTLCIALKVSADELLDIKKQIESKTKDETFLQHPIVLIFDNLNFEGQQRLLEYAQDLAAIDKYKKCNTVSEQEIG